MRPGNNLLYLPSTIFKVLDKITGPEIRKRGAEEYLLRCLILFQPWILQALSTPEPAPRNAWILGMPSSWKPFTLMLTVSWLPSSSAWPPVPPDIIVAKEPVGLCPSFCQTAMSSSSLLRKIRVKKGFDDEFVPQSTSNNRQAEFATAVSLCRTTSA